MHFNFKERGSNAAGPRTEQLSCDAVIGRSQHFVTIGGPPPCCPFLSATTSDQTLYSMRLCSNFSLFLSRTLNASSPPPKKKKKYSYASAARRGGVGVTGHPEGRRERLRFSSHALPPLKAFLPTLQHIVRIKKPKSEW